MQAGVGRRRRRYSSRWPGVRGGRVRAVSMSANAVTWPVVAFRCGQAARILFEVEVRTVSLASRSSRMIVLIPLPCVSAPVPPGSGSWSARPGWMTPVARRGRPRGRAPGGWAHQSRCRARVTARCRCGAGTDGAQPRSFRPARRTPRIPTRGLARPDVLIDMHSAPRPGAVAAPPYPRRGRGRCHRQISSMSRIASEMAIASSPTMPLLGAPAHR